MRKILFDQEISDNHRIRPEVRRVLAVQVSETEFEVTRFRKMRTSKGLEEFGDLSVVTIVDGVARWQESGNVPPTDTFVSYGLNLLPGFDAAKTTQRREYDNDVFFAKYRGKMKNYVPSSEEVFEMTAAYGPGG